MTEPSPTPPAAGPGSAGPAPRGARARAWWVAGLAIAGAVAVLAAIFASRDPDGLYRVAADKGFADAARSPVVGVLPGYTVPGLDGTASTIVAALVGIAIVFLLVLLLGRLLARRRKDRAA